MSSTLKAARSALYLLLLNDANLGRGGDDPAGVQVTYGEPATLDNEAVWVSGARRETVFAAIAGGRPKPPREENYRIAVVVHVLSEDGSAQDVFERIDDLVDIVEGIVASNRNLSNTVITAHVATTEDDVEPAPTGGHEGTALLEVACTARIT